MTGLRCNRHFVEAVFGVILFACAAVLLILALAK